MDTEVNIIEYFKKGFLAEKGITGIYRREKLFSRKNVVYKIEIKSGSEIKLYVLKKYKGKDWHLRIKNELHFYDLVGRSGLKVPHIFYKGENILVIEFISGSTLLDYILQKEDQELIPPETAYLENILTPLAGSLEYIYNFNRMLKSATGKSYVLNDMNLRNFLIADRKIYRVDFEDCRSGCVEEDIGKFIAFFITYDPAFTPWKKTVAEYMKYFCTDNMAVSREKIDIEIGAELQRMKERRIQ